MKILLATMQYGRGYHQGTERYLSILRSGLRATGHVVDVLGGDPEGRRAPLPLGAPVSGEDDLWHAPTWGRMAVGGVALADYRAFLEQHRPDVVHLASPAHIGVDVAQAALELRIPVVASIVDFWWLCPKHTLWRWDQTICDANVTWRDCLRCDAATHPRAVLRVLGRLPLPVDAALTPAYRRWIERRTPADQRRDLWPSWQSRQRTLLDLLARFSAVICLSQAGMELIGRRLLPGRAVRIQNGLEPHWFTDAPQTGDAQHPDAPARGSTPTLGFAGTLAPHKGAHVLLQALRRLGWRDVHVRLAGGGTDAGYQRRLRRLSRGLRVEFVGSVSPAEMPAFLRGLDLVVTPSLWIENLPMIVFESLAVGRPVLVSRVAGMSELTPPQYCFTPGDDAALAESLQRWRCDELGPCRPLTPILPADDMVRRTLAVYERCCAPAAS